MIGTPNKDRDEEYERRRRRASEFQAKADAEDATKQAIADGWSPSQEEILKTWAEKAAGYRWLHEHSARHYRSQNNKLVYSQIILSTLSGMGGFSMGTTGPIVGYSIAFANVIVALLTSFQKFVMCAEKSENHSTIGKQFATFYRNITLELSLNPCDRTECVELCKQCRIEYDRLLTVAPQVPWKIIEDFKRTFPTCKNKPDIANGLTDLKIWNKADDTKQEEAFVKMRMFYRLVYGMRGEQYKDAQENV